jgi:hypothetical protein
MKLWTTKPFKSGNIHSQFVGFYLVLLTVQRLRICTCSAMT